MFVYIQRHPLQTFTSAFLSLILFHMKIQFFSLLVCLGASAGLLSGTYLAKILYQFLIIPMCVTGHTMSQLAGRRPLTAEARGRS